MAISTVNLDLGMNSFVNSNERKPAKLWLNVGIKVGDELINLPVGIPLDTTKEVKAKGDYAKIASLRNTLLKKLIKACNQVKPGEQAIISNQLVVSLYHVADEPEVTVNEDDIPDFEI